MKHKVKKAESEAVFAKREPPIEAGSLIEELLPLFEEYFIGEVSLKDNAILYRMPNGQQFLISAKQVV